MRPKIHSKFFIFEVMEKRWHFIPPEDNAKSLELSSAINCPLPLATILVNRGVTSFEEARDFFNPNLANLHDPLIMADMKTAVERVLTAKKNGERILVYGDYDVDGTTSVSMMYSFLKPHFDNIDYYIPDRYTEGYGISKAGIDYASKNGFSVVIALDCGIKAIEQMEYAREKGIDFIICDHHRPGEKLPAAFAVLDPKRSDCEYPFKELSGCGVGFKLMQGLCAIEPELANANPPADFLDLLAVSIACDIVPVNGENRILLHHGLRKVNENPSPGIKRLLGEHASSDREITVSDLVFIVGPRINAAGRMEHATKAVALLTNSDETQLTELGSLINSQNQERKDLDRAINEEALQMIAEDSWYENAVSTVVYKPGWHKGVIGIVASRLIETHYKPTIVLTEYDGKVTGSARSVRGFDIYEAIDACSDIIEQFGGHKYAAGLSISPDKVDDFKEKFDQSVRERIKEEHKQPVLDIDAVLTLDEINNGFYKILKRMGPFGPKNMFPVFATHYLDDAGYSKVVGSDESHLRVVVKNEGSNVMISGIGFGMADKIEIVQSGEPFSIAYTIEENTFNGKTSLQMKVKDIRFTDELLQ